MIVLLAHLEPGCGPPPSVLTERLEAAAPDFPLMASRLDGAWWTPSSLPDLSVAEPGATPLDIAPTGSFDLRHEPPLRIVRAADGNWLLLCAHHFGFDGLGMVSLLRSLLTGNRESAPDYRVATSRRRPPTDALTRLVRPADRVAPSATAPRTESFVAAQVPLSGPNVTSRLAHACAEAAVAHNRAHGRPLRRLGLSIAVGGVGGKGATYRRVDVSSRGDVEGAVTRALADPVVPPDINGLPPGAFLLRPLLSRFSDTVLVSNLGRLDLPSVTSVEFYPVARGRSAVSVGAAGLAGRPTTLTLRARDLDPREAASLLERIVSLIR